jgi:hypothetical protein
MSSTEKDQDNEIMRCPLPLSTLLIHFFLNAIADSLLRSGRRYVSILHASFVVNRSTRSAYVENKLTIVHGCNHLYTWAHEGLVRVAFVVSLKSR